MNDFPREIPRTEQQDKDRVMPGDGGAPMKELADTLKSKGGQIILSLELFNPSYYAIETIIVQCAGFTNNKMYLFLFC